MAKHFGCMGSDVDVCFGWASVPMALVIASLGIDGIECFVFLLVMLAGMMSNPKLNLQLQS